MDLVEFVGVINKWKWIVVSIVVVMVAYTLFTGFRTTKMYSSESEIGFGLTQIASSSQPGINIMQNGDRFAATYAEVITNQQIMESALAKAGLDWPADQLRGRISTSNPKNTAMFLVSVSDSDPARSVVLTNAVSDAFVEYLAGLSKKGIDNSRAIIMDQLTKVEGELANAQADPTKVDPGRIRALQDSRDLAQKDYESLFDQQIRAADVQVLDRAQASHLLGRPLSQIAVINVAIGLLVGIVLTFIAEAVSKIFRSPEALRASPEDAS